MIRIIGAGFSGLSLAYFFTKSGFPVTIIEKKSRTGGVISSEFKNNRLVESAANGFLASEKIEELFSDIGITPILPKAGSKNKYIYRNGLKRWPLTVPETAGLIFKVVVSFVTGQNKPREQESLKTWAHRVLGSKGNDYLIQPMVNGIFAQRTDILSAKLVLGSLFFKRKKKRLKGLISARDGMGSVIERMETYLRKQGALFVLENSEKNNLDISQHNTFLAIDFNSARTMLPINPIKQPEIKKEGLTSLSLVRVTLNFKSKVDEIQGFGVLFPNKEQFFSLGVLANSKIFENRGDYNESWILGDSVLPNLMNLSDEKIIEKILLDRRRLFPNAVEIQNVSIHRWPQVIPNYDQNLESFLKNQSELVPNLTGNYLGVLGLTGIHERNYQIVQAYKERKNTK